MSNSVQLVEFSPEDALQSMEKALKTWYEVGDPLRFNLKPAAMGLLGEAGELVDLLKKRNYKKGFDHENFVELYRGEIGDIWYYLRILSFILSCAPDTATPYGSGDHALRLLGQTRFIPHGVPEDLRAAWLATNAAKINLICEGYRGQINRMGINDITELKDKLGLVANEWIGLAWLGLPPQARSLGTNPAHFYTATNWAKLKDGAHGWSEEKKYITEDELNELRHLLGTADDYIRGG